LADNSRTHELLKTKLGELGHPVAMVKFVKAEATYRTTPPTAEPVEEEPASPPATQQPASLLKPSALKKDKPAKKAAPTVFNKEDFKHDPLIQKALEVFKGQIVDVRG